MTLNKWGCARHRVRNWRKKHTHGRHGVLPANIQLEFKLCPINPPCHVRRMTRLIVHISTHTRWWAKPSFHAGMPLGIDRESTNARKESTKIRFLEKTLSKRNDEPLGNSSLAQKFSHKHMSEGILSPGYRSGHLAASSGGHPPLPCYQSPFEPLKGETLNHLTYIIVSFFVLEPNLSTFVLCSFLTGFFQGWHFLHNFPLKNCFSQQRNRFEDFINKWKIDSCTRTYLGAPRTPTPGHWPGSSIAAQPYWGVPDLTGRFLLRVQNLVQHTPGMDFSHAY